MELDRPIHGWVACNLNYDAKTPRLRLSRYQCFTIKSMKAPQSTLHRIQTRCAQKHHNLVTEINPVHKNSRSSF